MSALFKVGFTFSVTHSVFSCFFLLPLCRHTHLPSWSQLPIWKNQKAGEEALSWGLRWKRISFGWTAGGSTCRPQSYTVCRSKRLREGRGASKMFSAQTHMHARIHIQFALTSSLPGEELCRMWGLQTATVTGMTSKETATLAWFSLDTLRSVWRL